MFDKKMTNEEKLDAIYAMTLENHEVLKTIRRQQYISAAGRLLYWILILGSLAGTYYYIKPFIPTISDNASKVQDAFGQLNQLKEQFPETKAINKIIDGMNKPTDSSGQ